MIIGAAWKRFDKEGNEFLSCQIEIIGMKFFFNLFQVKEKTKENSSDYNIVTFSECKK